MKLIIGLGNPGKEYSRNRHNVGFRFVAHIARQNSIEVKKRQCQAEIGTGEIAGTRVLLARPRTFMNRSGDSVSQLIKKYHVEINDILVIYDDLDLPLGKIRLRHGGSSGGHKGIKSIASSLGNQDFNRLKIGIGRPPHDTSDEKVVSHVLSDFSAQEEKTIKPAIEKATEAVECFLTEGMVAAMNKFN
jgi:peptidyl-tRNA hydrolase, PTH1 family